MKIVWEKTIITVKIERATVWVTFCNSSTLLEVYKITYELEDMRQYSDQSGYKNGNFVFLFEKVVKNN